jgi:hypothetical protein
MEKQKKIKYMYIQYIENELFVKYYDFKFQTKINLEI